MRLDSKIYIAGHLGLVGSAILRCLRGKGYSNLLTRTRAELDLTRQPDVESFFHETKPEYVFLAAAKVGGIHANDVYPAEFIRENLAVAVNAIHAAYKTGVKRLLFLGSSCVYPKFAPQPMREQCLLTSSLEPTNRPYALAKIAGIEMCWSYNRQYKTQYLAVMPTNLFGPGDNFHPENSHVIPALIHRFHEAKLANSPKVRVWGTGRPKREFLYSDDLADGCVFLMNLHDDLFVPLLGQDRNDGLAPLINMGVGYDWSIREIAEMVQRIVGYEGMLEFDVTKPDGTPRKLMSTDRMSALGWRAKTSMEDGLIRVYEDFLRAYKT
jgi:GDP-L-fucose synthase